MMGVLQRTFAQLRDDLVSLTKFGTNAPSTTQKAESAIIVNRGYRMFLSDDDWSFLKPASSIYLWPDVAVVSTSTVACGPDVAVDGGVTVACGSGANILVVTATGGTPFLSTMVGLTMTVTGIGTRTITGYVSTSVVTVDTTFATSHTFSIDAGTTVTCTGATPFYPSMVGRTITVTGIGTRTITGYTSTTVVTVDSTFSGSHTFSVASAGYFGMPAGFSGFIDAPTYDDACNLAAFVQKPIEMVRNQRNVAGTVTGDPQWFALLPRAFTATTGQRWDMLVWPTPSALRLVNFTHRLDPDEMTADAEYPVGGPEHAITLEYACLSAMEAGTADTAYTAQYRNIYLPRSQRLDLQKRARNLGPSIDRSDGPTGRAIRQGTWNYT